MLVHESMLSGNGGNGPGRAEQLCPDSTLPAERMLGDGRGSRGGTGGDLGKHCWCLLWAALL